MAGALATAGTIGITTASASGDQPPEGARATVRVSPAPAAARDQEVSITGNCGGGTALKSVLGGLPETRHAPTSASPTPTQRTTGPPPAWRTESARGPGRSWSTAAAKRARPC
ncbi:hypothetical protein AB0F91_16595 [Amycolatopsis sp. NPDC023774]|uniref:hypothetical protein n=1 Tax=Amycolatopsis sp. NPDC023774 TaxID=3155015 RepID=UPI0033E0C27B